MSAVPDEVMPDSVRPEAVDARQVPPSQGASPEVEGSAGADESAPTLRDSRALELGEAVNRAPFAVRLEFFSGPMDLLLHLIHQREVPVSQVCLKDVCEQYLKIISDASFLDLEKASEYLVIAATLLAIKSRMLLPAGEGMTADEAELMNPEAEGEAFYDELRKRLEEYDRTRRRAAALIERPQLGVDTFSRIDRKALLPTPEMLAEPEEITSLTVLFAGLLRRIGATGKSYLVRLEPISVVSFMMKVMGSFGGAVAAIGSESRRSFREVLAGCARGLDLRRSVGGTDAEKRGPEGLSSARGVVIGTFIAVLELVKRGLVGVETVGESDFVIVPRFRSGDPNDMESARGDTPDTGFRSSEEILAESLAAEQVEGEEPDALWAAPAPAGEQVMPDEVASSTDVQPAESLPEGDNVVSLAEFRRVRAVGGR